jgi:hypothetical protein
MNFLLCQECLGPSLGRCVWAVGPQVAGWVLDNGVESGIKANSSKIEISPIRWKTESREPRNKKYPQEFQRVNLC